MKMENVQYTVIKDNGIIKAEVHGCTLDAFREFNKRFMFHSTSKMRILCEEFHGSFNFIMPEKFSVIVKLHPDDVWDEEKGKKIALRRLATKYNNALDKRLHNMYKALDKSMCKLEAYLEDHHLIE